ncbi:MAG: glycosyltransferase [Bacteroidota bacterium]
MKILLIHTHYREKGGEDAVFEQDFKLLEQTEHPICLTFKNKGGFLGAIQFATSIWNTSAARKIKKIIATEKPDIIHIHNLHFAVGTIALRVAKKAGVPVVKTLHNYRLLCPSATLFSNGNIFTNSVSKNFPWKAVRNKVYRNSFLQTFWLAAVIWLHKKSGTWQHCNKYIVQSEFAKKIYVQSSLGIQTDKFVVNANFVNQLVPDLQKKKDHFLFVGRLSQEKGITLLLEAFIKTDYELHIAGDGPLKELVLEACITNKRIKYLGRLDQQNVINAMHQCTALIFPSMWYEGMPMTILEAFSIGIPVIASDDGAMATLIEHGINGRLFMMGNANSLATELKTWNSLSCIEKNNYSENTLTIFKRKYTATIYKKHLLSIYNDIIESTES